MVEEPPEMVGGLPCLDFVNTKGSYYESGSRDLLTTFRDLVSWTARAGILNAQAGRGLARRAARDPEEAARVLRSARRLRALLFAVLSASARGARPAPRRIEALNQSLLRALPHRRLHVTASGFSLRFHPADSLERPLWEVTLSALSLLTSDDLDRLKQCPDPDGCGWLFLDASKNRSRRWCSMKTCGNGAKTRRFQDRHR